MSELTATMKDTLLDARTLAQGRVNELTEKVAAIEGELKPVKDALKEAKVEVARVERMLKVYDGHRIKRPRGKTAPPPVLPKAADATGKKA